MKMDAPVIGIRNARAGADIALAGAELRSWKAGGHELLWDADARWWPRSSPLLFPIVGRLRGGVTRIGGRPFAMGIHGFAHAQPFEVRAAAADQVTLGLSSSDATRAQYPFDFDLRVRYQLLDDGLDIALDLTNTGQRTLPFALGLHPGLRWPFSAASPGGHAIVFDAAESPQVPVITADGLFSSERRQLPLRGNRLALEPALFARDALCFLDARSRGLRFESPDGAALVMTARGFPHWALWTRAGAPFLSIEAWTGYGDPEHFDGELADKPSMRALEPGACASHGLRLCFEPARTA